MNLSRNRLAARLADDAPPSETEAMAAAARDDSGLRIRMIWRLGLVMIAFVFFYGAVVARMGLLAVTPPEEREADAGVASRPAAAVRAAITDRNGAVLALNIPSWSIYAHPREMIDREEAAQAVFGVLGAPDLETLRHRFREGSTFAWIKRPATPADVQAVNDLGLPGIRFGSREARIYPAGRIAAHVLGGAKSGVEGVHFAETLGLSGLEKEFEARLSDPALTTEPLRTSIDITVQAALTEVLAAGIQRYEAIAGSATLMEARTGRIVAMVSAPDFDPNHRPKPGREDDPNDPRLLHNRAVQDVAEFGSIFKIFTAAQALDLGLVSPMTEIDTRAPIRWGAHRIDDVHRLGDRAPVRRVVVESSNVGSARLAQMIGVRRQQDFLGALGLLEAPDLEIAEAGLGKPLLPEPKWSELSAMTIAFGHGLSVTQVHIASAYAAMVNGGLLPKPTLLADAPGPGEEARVISERTSAQIREMMRAVVQEEAGTANFADVAGYDVGGKTGTAEKVANRRYDRGANLNTFAGVFPMRDPEYVLVLTLDEAIDKNAPGRPRGTAGWTAAPVAGAAIRRIAPLLGMAPIRREDGVGEEAPALVDAVFSQ